jgi:hypothetical protein
MSITVGDEYDQLTFTNGGLLVAEQMVDVFDVPR